MKCCGRVYKLDKNENERKRREERNDIRRKEKERRKRGMKNGLMSVVEKFVNWIKMKEKKKGMT